MDYILRKFKYKHKRQSDLQSSAPNLVVTSPQSLNTSSNSSKFDYELEERLSLRSLSSPDKRRANHRQYNHNNDHRNGSHWYNSRCSLNSSPSHSSASSDGTELKLNTSAVHKILMGRPVVVRRPDYNEDESQIDDNSFAMDCLYWHNVFRAKHGSPPLSVSNRLVNMAQEWANYLAHTDSYKYRNSEGIGENLMSKWTCHPNFDPPGEDIVKFWYSEIELYNYTLDPSIMHTLANHFTQIVWRSTTEFGIGKAHTRGGKCIVVANYRPAGNLIGQFHLNVLPYINDDIQSTITTTNNNNHRKDSKQDVDSLNDQT